MNWRYGAASDPTTPASILTELYEFPDCRLHLSDNKSTPPAILELLGQENAFSHLDTMNRRIAVANVLRNPNTPTSTIKNILTWTEGRLNVYQPEENPIHDNPRLKDYFYSAAAGNVNTPVDYLRKLADSDDSTTIFWLLPNPNLPRDVIARFVAKVLITFDHEHLHSISTVAQNPSLIESEILSLSKHPMGYVRDAIARNKSTSGKILMTFLHDEYFMTRIGAVWNENLPLEGLNFFANQTRAELRALGHNWVDDYLKGVRDAVLKSPHATEELRNWVSSPEWFRER
jgi:hypothetical protein